ncbi:MAG: hypothetical protein ACK5TU_01640, partial [Cyclobacteriaceae bacterium]
DKGLRPYKKQFYREITRDDILRLLEIRIKRISKYDSFKADELMRDLEKELKETLHHLKHLTDYAIAYYQNLLDKYGKGRERKTEIKSFTSVAATEVIANNQKLYVNREDGFIGWSLKKDEFIADCSELDDVIVIRRDGKAKVSRINEKVFMGKDILHVGIWRKGDERMIYNLVYSDGKGGITYAKRFAMPAITRDKEYNLDMGNPNSKVHYLSANPNGEAEVVEVKLTPASSARKKIFDFDFSELEVKGRGVRGNMITKYPVRKVDFKESRGSTLSGLDLWFDEASGRLNKDKRGKYVGKFDGDDQIIAITKSGAYKITSYELTNRYEPEKTILVQKYNPKKVVTAVYLDGESKQYFVKRFLIETNTLDKEFGFISEGIGSRLDYASTSDSPEIEMDLVKGKGKEKETEVVSLEEIVDVKGWKALGNRLSQYKVTKIKSLEDPDETGFEEGDSDNDVATVETSKSSQPSKKKFPYATAPGNRWEEPEEGEQASLFEESQSQANQSQPLVNGQPPMPKEKKPTAEQANLFEENQSQKKEVKKDDDEKGYTPGQTVELDF